MGRGRPEQQRPFLRARVREQARVDDGLPPVPRHGREIDVAGSAKSRPGPGCAGLDISEDVQPLRRSRSSARPLRRLRTLPGGAAAPHGLLALRCASPRGPRGHTSAPRRFHMPGMSRTTSPLRPSGRAVELRTAAQQPHPSHEVSPGARRGGRSRAAPRTGGGVPPRLCGAWCGDRNAHLPVAASPAWIQPRGGAGRRRPPGAGAPAAAWGPHPPEAHPAPGEGGKRGGTPHERRGRIQRSPLAGGSPAGSDRGRRPDDRGYRIGACGGPPGPGRRADRDLVLCPDAALPSRLHVATHPCIRWIRPASGQTPSPPSAFDMARSRLCLPDRE